MLLYIRDVNKMCVNFIRLLYLFIFCFLCDFFLLVAVDLTLDTLIFLFLRSSPTRSMRGFLIGLPICVANEFIFSSDVSHLLFFQFSKGRFLFVLTVFVYFFYYAYWATNEFLMIIHVNENTKSQLFLKCLCFAFPYKINV